MFRDIFRLDPLPTDAALDAAVLLDFGSRQGRTGIGFSIFSHHQGRWIPLDQPDEGLS
jgi:hypothetical protein